MKRPARSPPPSASTLCRGSRRRSMSPSRTAWSSIRFRDRWSPTGSSARSASRSTSWSQCPCRLRSRSLPKRERRATARSACRSCGCPRPSASPAAWRWKCSAPEKSASGSHAGSIRRIRPSWAMRVAGRESPSMVAFRFRPQQGTEPRSLSVTVARYTPQAVLIANVEEARYDALVDEEGKALVRARYAVRNNQRAFLGVTLPAGATLWSAAVADRPLRPGVAAGGSLSAAARERPVGRRDARLRRRTDLRAARDRVGRERTRDADAARRRSADRPHGRGAASLASLSRDT